MRIHPWVTGFLLLITTALGLDALGWLYKSVVGRPLPDSALFPLLGICILVCASSLALRYAFDVNMEYQPLWFASASDPLLIAGNLSLFFTFALMARFASTGWSIVWFMASFAAYYTGEASVRSIAYKRAIAYRLGQAKIWFPEMTPEEQMEEAIIWNKTGLSQSQRLMKEHTELYERDKKNQQP